MGGTHRGLDVQGLNVLPVLLQQGDKEVDRHRDVGEDLLLSLGNGANSDTNAQDLLQLELDSTGGLIDLSLHVLILAEQSGELTSLVQTGAQNTGNLTDDGIRGKEEVVLLGQLLDELLVLVELLESLNVQGVEAQLLSLVAVGSITEDADSHARLGGDGKLEGTSETLILLGIVVLKTNLELDGLNETALSFLRFCENLANVLFQFFRLDFTEMLGRSEKKRHV